MLSRLSPGDTFVLRFTEPGHLRHLLRWLSHADTIIGMNLQFDISYLRAYSGALAHALTPFRHTLIDLSVVNYLDCESRPEKSLKNLGPVLGTHVYRSSDLERLSDWPTLLNYNAQDTHNTLLAVSHLASRVLRNPHAGDKLSSFCIQFYSDTLWSCIHMTEAGVPFSHPALCSLLTRLSHSVALCERLCSPSLLLSGEGSDASKRAFLSRAIAECSPSPLDDPMLELTPKTHEISWSDRNRTLISSCLPPDSPMRRTFKAADIHAKAQKLLSTYVLPLLIGARKNPSDRTSILCPLPGVPPCPTPAIPSCLIPTSPTAPKKKSGRRKGPPKKTKKNGRGKKTTRVRTPVAPPAATTLPPSSAGSAP